MLRALVTAGFLLVAALVLWASFILGVETSAGTLFINLGTEIVGIVITVAYTTTKYENITTKSKSWQRQQQQWRCWK